MLTLNGIITNRSCRPEACRGRNPPTILRGNTHSSTHSVQKKTRNGYDNCSAKCLTLNNKISVLGVFGLLFRYITLIQGKRNFGVVLLRLFPQLITIKTL